MAVVHREPFGDDKEILLVDADPNGGITSTVGSVAYLTTGVTMWRNTNGGTAWNSQAALKGFAGQPGLTEDVDAGYALFDIVTDLTTGIRWICTSAAAAAATYTRFDASIPLAGTPTVTNDEDEGYSNGFLRLDQYTGWVCQEKTAGAAVWNPFYDASGAADFAINGKFRSTYDFAVDGGVAGAIPFGPELPDNAYVTEAHYEVITTLTSATDAATVALGHADDAAGLVVAIAISDVSNPWDSATPPVVTIAEGTAANFTAKTTARRQLALTIAGGDGDLTAGKLVVFGTYATTE